MALIRLDARGEIDAPANATPALPASEQRACVLHPWEEIFARYLSLAPAAHAMFRAAELRPLAGMRIERPVLDLGCGAGEFVQAAVAGDVDAGLDASPRKLAKARRTGRYLRLDCADAANMPYPDDCFRSIFSISVLEHIADPQGAMAEAYRVLQPGGLFLATIVLRDLNDCLAAPEFMRWIAGKRGANLWTQALNAVFAHRTLLSQDEWEEIAHASGFCAIESQRVVSPAVIQRWEAMLPVAAPHRIAPRMARRLAFRPTWFCRRVRQALIQATRESEAEGACLLLAARKTEYARFDRARVDPGVLLAGAMR
jgi:SAM-dependent methyltransferase